MSDKTTPPTDPILLLIRAARRVNALFADAERYEAIGEDRLDAIWELQRALALLKNHTPTHGKEAGG